MEKKLYNFYKNTRIEAVQTLSHTKKITAHLCVCCTFVLDRIIGNIFARTNFRDSTGHSVGRGNKKYIVTDEKLYSLHFLFVNI